MKRILLWYGAGIAAVAVPFAIWYDPTTLWNAIIAGGIGGSVFLLSATVWMFRNKVLSLFQSSVAVVIVMLLTVGYFVETMQMRAMTRYQAENLKLVRAWISDDIMMIDKVYGSMMPVMREYYRQSGARQSLVEVFTAHYREPLRDGTFNRTLSIPGMDPSKIFDALTFVSYSGDSLVRYAVVDTFVHGTRPDFLNATGQRGKMEAHAELTKGGILYERVN